MRVRASKALAVVCLTLVPGSSLLGAIPPPLFVTNTNDSGVGSLRQAILDANARPGADEIVFQIGGSAPHVIQPLSPLPVITEAVVIDGKTNNDYQGTPVIAILGGQAGKRASGLTFTAPCNGQQYAVVSGLMIGFFDEAGIMLAGGCTALDGNDLGIIETQFGIGVVANRYGVEVVNGTGNLIGLSNGKGNVISGNLIAGVYITVRSMTNSVFNNSIGTDPTGVRAIPNGNGVYTGGAGVLIGGNASENLVGDTGDSNLISGNDGDGVRIDPGPQYNYILDNVIGASTWGDPLPNTGHGVFIDRTSFNGVGFANRQNELNTHANRIWFNGGDGVRVVGPKAAGNTIRHNSIANNGGLGIDLDGDGVTMNDPGDGDTGPNGFQNFPEIQSAQLTGLGEVVIDWTFTGAQGQFFTVDFYSSRACDPSGFGEGGTWLGSADVRTDQFGYAPPIGGFQKTITTTLPSGNGAWITATATNYYPGDTSEFSRCVRARGPLTNTALLMHGSAAAGPGGAGARMTYDIEVANLGPSAAQSVTVTDALPPSLGFVSCSATGGGACGGTANDRLVTFSALAPGATATVEIVADVVPHPIEIFGPIRTAGDVFTLGGSTITNTVTVDSLTLDDDLSNNTATVALQVPGVPDTTPPAIAGVSATPSRLWPPNGAMADVAVSYTVSDVVDPAPVCSLGVTSNEGGSSDWAIVDAHHVRLRATRLEAGAGRVYTIGVDCADSSGNHAIAPVIVTVPHDRR